MTEKIEIYPKAKNSFFAISFTGVATSAFLSALAEKELSLVPEPEGWFIDGTTEGDTLAIKSGYYFVSCGPYWDVLSPTELMDDFRIG